jgi:hypothetical protein
LLDFKSFLKDCLSSNPWLIRFGIALTPLFKTVYGTRFITALDAIDCHLFDGLVFYGF